tara:strand:+ start:3361 stop:3843 length:483 start_codon:yes stop_codon:yes gene_type:complete
MSCGGHIFQPFLRAAVLGQGIKLPLYGQTTMSARPDANIILIGPIGQIMPAFLAGARMIGHFIGRKTMGVTNLLRQIIHIRRHIFFRQNKAALLMGVIERCAAFYGQLIERQMSGDIAVVDQSQRLFQFRFPCRQGLAHTGINQIKARPGEIFLGQGDGV